MTLPVIALLSLVTAALLSPPLLAAPPQGKPHQKITIDMHQAELGHVLRLIAEVSDKNLVYGEEVKGKITLKLKDVPWDRALAVILQTQGLAADERSDVIRIVPQAVLDAERLAALDAQAAYTIRGPLVTRVIPLSYANAEEMAEHVKPLLSPRGSVSVDRRNNALIIRDTRGSGALRF